MPSQIPIFQLNRISIIGSVYIPQILRQLLELFIYKYLLWKFLSCFCEHFLSWFYSSFSITLWILCMMENLCNSFHIPFINFIFPLSMSLLHLWMKILFFIFIFILTKEKNLQRKNRIVCEKNPLKCKKSRKKATIRIRFEINL